MSDVQRYREHFQARIDALNDISMGLGYQAMLVAVALGFMVSVTLMVRVSGRGGLEAAHAP